MSTLLKNAQKSIKAHHVLAIVGFAVAIYAIYRYNTQKATKPEGMLSGALISNNADNLRTGKIQKGIKEDYAPVIKQPKKVKTTPMDPVTLDIIKGKTITNPADLLPIDGNSEWAELNPTSQQNSTNQNMLNPRYHVGIDAGLTRNSNRQLRSEPANPTTVVSPWMISTMVPDTYRLPLDGCSV
jgi:hypothetical protein